MTNTSSAASNKTTIDSDVVTVGRGQERSERILIVGTGPAGLVTARTLLDDGFDVTLVGQEASPGGEWVNTYPGLKTNGPWEYYFSGLDMPRPRGDEGKTIPGETMRRYAEDFWRYFVCDRPSAKTLFNTKVESMAPLSTDTRAEAIQRGWKVSMRSWRGPETSSEGWQSLLQSEDGPKERVWEETFDRVVLACGYLGHPILPPELRNSNSVPVPVFHSSALSDPANLSTILSAVPATDSAPPPRSTGSTTQSNEYPSNVFPSPPPASSDSSGVIPSGASPSASDVPATVLVLGAGKSALDLSALLASLGRPVVLAWRGEMRWFSPCVPPGGMGAGRVDVYMNPPLLSSRRSTGVGLRRRGKGPDNWMGWFLHCTTWGAKWTRGFWGMIQGFWSMSYGTLLPLPSTNPFLTVCHFAGGVDSAPTDFLPLLGEGRIKILPGSSIRSIQPTPASLDSSSMAAKRANVTFQADLPPSKPGESAPNGILGEGQGQGHGEVVVRCGAIVAATGYDDNVFPFLSSVAYTSSSRTTNDSDQVEKPTLPSYPSFGLTKVGPLPGWEDRVRLIRSGWRTFDGLTPQDALGRLEKPDPGREIHLPLVWRGIVPIGRWDQRDLAVVGGTKALSCPNQLMEVESHWISSFFSSDPALLESIPHSREEAADECHEYNDYLRARYPGIEPAPYATQFTGFGDNGRIRELLKDMGLDPWRQKQTKPGFLNWLRWYMYGWLDSVRTPEDFAGIGEERRALRIKRAA